MPGAFLMMEVIAEVRFRIAHTDHVLGGIGLLFNYDIIVKIMRADSMAAGAV
jgi:hypothetical protein